MIKVKYKRKDEGYDGYTFEFLNLKHAEIELKCGKLKTIQDLRNFLENEYSYNEYSNRGNIKAVHKGIQIVKLYRYSHYLEAESIKNRYEKLGISL